MENQQTQTFKVDGMSCQHCVAAITRAIQALDGTALVAVDLGVGQVQVRSVLSQVEVLRVLGEEGYPGSPLAGS